MKIFILEDDDNRIEQFKKRLEKPGRLLIIAKNVEEAKLQFVAHEPFSLMFLDHDLADEHYQHVGEVEQPREGTGTEFCEFLKNFSIGESTEVYIHSLNHHGRTRMHAILRDAGIVARIIPFSQLIKAIN